MNELTRTPQEAGADAVGGDAAVDEGVRSEGEGRRAG